MSREFAITTPSPKVSVDATGRGEVHFTVSNITAHPLRVQVRVNPSPNLPPAWVSVRGAPVLELPAGSTSVFIVEARLPPGTVPGDYFVRLTVADEALPDERYEESPSVALEVTAAAPAPAKAFPRKWLMLGALAAAAAVAAVLFLVLHKSAPPELQCQASLSRCSGKCVDTLTDEENCGSCGTQCGERVCMGGTCRCKSYREAILADGPAGYWRLDESPSAAADSSGNNIIGTVWNWNGTGAKGLVSEQGNAAGTFGTGGISLPTRLLDFQGSQGVTIEAWVRTMNPTASQIIFSQQSCSQQTLQLYVYGGKAVFRLVGYRDDGSTIPEQLVLGTSNVADGLPHHLVGVRDLGTRKISIYVDGRLEKAAPDETRTNGSLIGNIETWIGRRYPCRAANEFNGVIDELAVYRKALTPEQIAAHYHLGQCSEAP